MIEYTYFERYAIFIRYLVDTYGYDEVTLVNELSNNGIEERFKRLFDEKSSLSNRDYYKILFNEGKK